MKRAGLIVLLMFTATTGIAQARDPVSSFRMHYVVSPADGNPNAKTAEEINKLNLRLAASGNTEAYFQLGLAYMQGVGVTQDLTKAEQDFRIGAIKPEDKSLVSNFYLEHGWFPYSPEKAVDWLLAAGRSSDLFAAAQTYQKFNPPQEGKAAGIYRELLTRPENPEFRRAQMELGNLVLDGKYGVSGNAADRALNLEWARTITQELLGQQEYTIAVAYSAAVDGVPHDDAMWLRFCKRAAAYNVDLAQQFYGQGILEGEISGASRADGYAWARLASDKRFTNKTSVAAIEKEMSPAELSQAQASFDDLVQAKAQYGAYYPANDSLRNPNPDALSGMPADDPDVQLRRAFALEKSGKAEDYKQAFRLYRIARDRRGMDIKVVLGRDHMYGADSVPRNARLAKYWLEDAAMAGSKPAALYLAKWYRGDGDGRIDPVQGLAWELIGHEGGTNVVPPPELTTEQKIAAMQLYAKWLVAHPGWVQ